MIIKFLKSVDPEQEQVLTNPLIFSDSDLTQI